MIRRSIIWTIDTVAIMAAATFGACYVLRGIVAEPERPSVGKRTPAPKDLRVN